MRKYESGIRNRPKDERPREKLLRDGEHALSNTELLAILLRTGVKGESAIDLPRRIKCLTRIKSYGKITSRIKNEYKLVCFEGGTATFQPKADPPIFVAEK